MSHQGVRSFGVHVGIGLSNSGYNVGAFAVPRVGLHPHVLLQYSEQAEEAITTIVDGLTQQRSTALQSLIMENRTKN